MRPTTTWAIRSEKKNSEAPRAPKSTGAPARFVLIVIPSLREGSGGSQPRARPDPSRSEGNTIKTPSRSEGNTLQPLCLRHHRQPAALRHLADVLRDSHRAELRPAHRAELRRLEHLLRQRLVVHRPRRLG